MTDSFLLRFRCNFPSCFPIRVENGSLLPAAGAQVFRSLSRHGSRGFSCQPHLVMHRQDFHAEDADLMLGSQSPVRMHVNVEPFVQPGDITYRPFLWAGAHDAIKTRIAELLAFSNELE